MDTNKDFKDKPLKFYINYLEECAESIETADERSDAVTQVMENLVRSNRLLDISSLYVFLKSASVNERKTGVFYEPAKNFLKGELNNLFIKSTTYNNTELREMFSDIIGKDTGLLIELVSFIFRKHNMFGMSFSDNINKQLIQIAENDIETFIEHADIGFLAFYLSAMTELSFVPKEHIEQLTKMILYQFNSEKYTSKILEAMHIRPAADILLLFLISEHERDRLKALQLLRDKLRLKYADDFRKSFAKKAPYFIERAVNGSLFYNFHNIPLAHKEIFAQITEYTGINTIRGTVLPLLRAENTDGDPRVTESKTVFVRTVEKFTADFPDLIPELTKILRDEKIEIEVKEMLRKTVYQTK